MMTAAYAAPDYQTMREVPLEQQWTYGSVQVGPNAISTKFIETMKASECCFCCGCFSTLEVKYHNPETKERWIEKFRFWCDSSAAYDTLTKINEHLQGKSLSHY